MTDFATAVDVRPITGLGKNKKTLTSKTRVSSEKGNESQKRGELAGERVWVMG